MPDKTSRVAALSPEQLQRVFERLRAKAPTAETGIGRQPRDGDAIPLSFSQERLWFLDRLLPGTALYNLPSGVRLTGPLRPEVLRRSLMEVARRHEALRTTFAERDGQPFQVIAPEPDVRLPLVDLAGLPEMRREAEAVRLLTEEARRPFDLERGPLLRTLLVRMGPAEHAFGLTLHHIVSDGWSSGVLIREMAALYGAFASGAASPLPAPVLQLADYAIWQRQRLQGSKLESLLAYWRGQLTGVPPLELPADRPRADLAAPRGGRLPLALGPETARRLQALAQAEGATFFMALLALFEALLARTAGQEDFAVGSPIANRNRSELESVIGFFSNTVVLRADLRGAPGFRELLRRVREAAVGAYAHEEMPFEKLVEALQPERDLGRNPLFQVSFAFQNQPAAAVPMGEIRVSPLPASTAVAKFDLGMTWREQDGGLAGVIESDAELFDATTVARFARHFERLLGAALDEPDRPVESLPVLDEAERHQLLREWGAPAVSAAAAAADATPVHRRIAAVAAARPEAPAIDGVTYGELVRRSRALAARLRQLGVGPEVRVPVIVGRTPELGIALLGVLEAGGVFVPLDPGYPEDRLGLLLDTALEGQARPVVVASPAGFGAMPRHHARELHTVPVPDLEHADRGDGWSGAPDPLPDHPAYVIFTSGSTGTPKGVTIPHRGLAGLVDWYTEVFGLTPEDRVSHLAGLGFDATVLEMWPALASGAALRMAPEAVRADPERLIGWLAAERVSVAFLPTPLAEAALGLDWPDQPEGWALRAVSTGGDRLHQSPPPDLPFELVNLYGPTEGTVCATAFRMIPGGPGEPGAPPIGGPIAGMRVLVADPRGAAVPIGVPGELWIGGAGLARGYLGLPGMTAAAFVPDPESGADIAPGERLYRTGDRVRWRTDGRLEFLGRTDGQVKVRGVRIEPGEVESALLNHPAVRAAAVVAQSGPAGTRLVAHVVLAGPVEGGAAGLAPFLRSLLPEALVPGLFVERPDLPLTQNGKVDRAALAAESPAAEAAAYAPPETLTQELLAGIWEELLGREAVGVRDDFFALGGHSLLATRLLARVRSAFGVDLPVRSLFEAPTVEALAAAIDAAREAPRPALAEGGEEGSTEAPASDLVPVPREPGEMLPLSFSQERLWFLDRLDPGTPTFNIPMPVDLVADTEAGPDVPALAAALDEVVRRHESLRTTFHVVDGEPRQRVAAALSLPLPVVDLAGLPAPAAAREAERLAARQLLRRFDLERGPLLDALLLRLDARRFRFLPVVHHIVADGWSVGVLVREVAALYEAFTAGQPSPLPPLAVQYPDFALWQRRTLAARWDAELGYWLERLGGEIAPLDLPTDRLRPAVQTFRGLRCRKVLGAALAGRLRAFAQEEGATVFMVLLAAVDALFHRWTGQEDILVGAPVAGRQRVETEGLIGFFLNTLVLRADLSGDPSLRGLVARVREVTLGAFSHQEIPFEAILARLQGERDLSRTPLFQVMFNLLNFPASEIRLPGVTLEAVTAPEVLSKFDMTFYVSEGTAGADSIRIDVIYNADLFAAARIDDFLDQLEALLESGLERPDEPLGRVALVTERARALLPDPAAPLDASWNGAVHELFAARARSAPDRPAIADRDGAWTYGELHEASDRLAGWLAAHGVGRGDRVAVFAHRSAPVAAAVLAALKAGAAFAMLDPAYPASRLVDMLDLAAPRAWLHLEAAGPAPAEVAAWLDAASCPRFELPRGRGGAGDLLDRLAGLAGFAGTGPRIDIGPDDAACVGFTSGSTGKPKAILGRHGPLSHFLPWQCERFGLTAEDRFSLLSGLAHDPLQRDLFTPFFLGAAIAVPDPEDLGIPGRLAAWMAREGVTVAHLTPAMGQVLTEPPVSGEVASIPTLRRVLLVGDALTRLDVARIRRLAPGVTCVNLYGSTETQRAVGFHEADPEAEGNKQVLPLGRGMKDVQLLVLNRAGSLAGIGEVGEIAVRSPHLAHGYLDDEALTAERFRVNPFTGAPGDRLYRTGDLGRYLPDGEVAFAGRADLQVKIRGFRIEPAEIEACLGALPGVRESIVLPRGEGADRKLVAYVVPVHPETAGAADVAVLRESLRQRLPAYMVPAAFHLLERLPLTPNGKVDRKALAGIEPGEIGLGIAGGGGAAAPVPPGNDLERQIAAAWRDVLGVEHVGVHDNFFDLGGHSLMLVRLHGRLQEIAGRELPLIDLFAHPDVRSQAEMLARAAGKTVEVSAPVRPAAASAPAGTGKIAIVGLAGRFPQAPDVETFWRNLRDGVDAVSSFSDEELLAAGTPPELLGDPRFLRARGVLQDEDLFDAAFFEYPPLQAELMDPQLRLFLECCWQALEDAGYDSARFSGAIGVHAGVTLSTYFLHNLYTNPELIRAVGGYQAAIGTDRDYLTSQVSYKLGLTGPSVNVQTACSTSLVAVHLACQALLGGECDMALAGGVSIKVPQVTGYLYNEGGIDSATGRCRPFDAAADGTVWGSGLGVVVLKRLEDALAAGDTVRAVILGSAVNNDGSFKVGFTAPSVDAQARVIAAAQARAGVDPATVSYVEAHGTGTALGDPIEAMALRRAFGVSEETGTCYLGSVKSNVGHLGAAAGVASLIKTVLALEHRQIPPSLHFERLNPAIDFAGTPFRIADRLIEWKNGQDPRRAGVSSFGLGGTNAHVVLEEAPALAAEDAGPRPSRPWQTLLLSARNEPALAEAAANLVGWLESRLETDLADVAWTLETGRRAFPWRRAVVCRDPEQARQALAGEDPEAVLDGWREDAGRPVAFLFPGQGAQYAGMARGLYEEEPVFRREIDACAVALVPHLGGLDLRELLFPPQDPESVAAADRELTRTRFAQPALFAVEYTLARLWMSWGVRPWALLGHSLGEYVAAALAGVFELGDALALVAARGELMQALPEGAMASVELSEPEVTAVLARLAEETHGGLSLAAVNAPSLCVVSGPEPAVAAFEARLAAEGVQTRRLHTSHAFHSAMVEPALAPFAERLARVELRPPSLPFVSNLTGDWITADQATDPAYWVRHLRAPVRFADGAARLLAGTGGEPPVLLEAGPGRALGSLVRQAAQAAESAPPPAVASLRHPKDPDEDGAVLARARARLWLSGADLDWAAVHQGERRRRVPLPSYPFQRRRYWVEPKGIGLARSGAAPETAGLSAEALELQAAERERAAAARPRHARPEDLRQAYVAPANELEARIAGLFEGLLGLSGVGGHDDFFELGGHSLLGTQLLSRLRDELRIELPLDALFSSPTAAGLAARVEATRQEMATATVPSAAAAGPPLVPYPRSPEEPQPLSFGQERLWFLDRLQPGSAAYNIPAVLRLAGPLDPAVLERALGEVVRRHEVLRTTFPEAEGIPVQQIHPVDPAAPFTLPVLDVAGEASEAEAYRLASQEASRPFDLAAGPVMRALLLRLGEADHLLAVTFHHIATDGWSIGVLVREMEALYHAFAAGEPSPLPELPLQYADYARWQREWLSGERLAHEVAFWRERLMPEPPVLEMPVDYPRQALETYRGDRLHVFFPKAVPEALAAAGQARGGTLFMALLAGFAAFLARYTGLADIAVGSPIAGRTRAETEGLIGLFINTLVLRLGLADDPPFDAILARARETALAAYAHQEVPFEKLVEELQPERRLGSSPLFQVLLILQNTPTTVPARAGLELCPLDFHPGVSRFDLTLSLTETADGLGGYFEYKADLVEAATVRRWAGHLENLVLAAAADPGLRLSALPLLAPAERHQIVAGWNDTAPPMPGDRSDSTVHALFAAQARRTPEALALVFEGEALTYRELDARSTLLARHLLERGLAPEGLVGIALGRSVELLVAVLGVLKAGGAYLPLDPSYPADRLAYMLADSGAGLLLAQQGLASRLPAFDRAAVLALEAGWGAGSADRDQSELPERVLHGESLAYVIYTSGSTGRPKGVQIPHRALTNFLLSMAREPGLTAADRLLAVTSLSFDIAALELYLPLITGASLEMVSTAVAGDGPRLLERLGASGATVMQATPATWRMLLDAGWQAGWDAATGHRPRLALAGGEAVAADLAASLAERAGAVWNVYGPTETTIWSSLWPVAGGAEGATVPIGRPLANTGLHVLDPWGNPAPPGVPGELVIGGTGVARGYLGRPELTAERFVPDGLSGAAGGRLYRTGDLARRRAADGALEFLGRLDQQVKVRGHRIELGEIEAALAGHPAAAQSAVVPVEGAGGAVLVAYVIPADPAAADGAALRSHVAAALPPYMVPAAVVFLESFPLTPNRKVDRQALARIKPRLEAGAAGAGAGAEYAAPRTPEEEVLAAVWADVLGRERVGIDDDFFALGGHSLLATRIASRIHRTLGVAPEVRWIFERPTVRGLAERIGAAQGESRPAGLAPVSAAAAAPALVPVEAGRDLPLSFAQQRLWFLDRLEPGGHGYNLSTALRLEGDLDVAALGRALATIVRRHEALRTRFPEVEGQPVQAVEPAEEAARIGALPVADLASLPQGMREAELRRLATAAVTRPFDLQRGPVLRTALFRLGEREHALVAVVHHIAADAWSIGLFVRELTALYSGGRELPPLRVQYSDFAVWQRQWLAGATLDALIEAWREQLAGAPAGLDLPTDRPYPPVQSYRGGSLPLRLDAEETAALRALCRGAGVTLFMALLAGFQALLHRYSGQDDVVVGSPIAGRTREEVEPLIGVFLNNLALRARFPAGISFDGLLAQVRETALGAYALQDLPFEKLVEELHPARDLARPPVFQVLLVLQNAPSAPLDLPGVAVSPLKVESGTAKYELAFWLAEDAEGIGGSFEYNADLFDRETAARMLGHFRRLLAAAAANPRAAVASLPLIGEDERRLLVSDWNATAVEHAGPPVFAELFEAQAARLPDEIAVISGGESLTYGELDRRANRLARHLRRLGVGPEGAPGVSSPVVGIALERSAELPVALLAVMKTGGAYLPLDPAYPEERLAYMLADSGAAVVITQESLRESLPLAEAWSVSLDADARAIGRESAAPLPARPDGAGLAYVLYTSGSTGRPKGVEVPHGALANFLRAMRDRPGLGPRDVLVAVTSLSFDIAGLEIYLPLLAGARVVLASRDEAQDGARLRALLQASGATVLQGTPATWRLLLAAGWPGDPGLKALVGGEALPADLAAELVCRTAGLWNLYGPTETTIWSTVEEVRADAPVTIGRPIANTEVYVVDRLDPQGTPAPVGVPGELLIGGAGVARGYHGRPDLTAERFVPDPFGGTAERRGGRLYRTGDLARFRPDGALEYLGRLDHQVKVHGFRIEPGEIEAALARHPAVAQAVVVAIGGSRLAAFYVARQDVPEAELRTFLAASLPSYMVPASFTPLAALPLTPNGKVDRKALLSGGPALAAAAAEKPAYAAPRDPVEETLAAIWGDVLGVERVGIHDDFFALGGHSILATRLMFQVRDRLGLDLPLRTLFEAPTVAALAAVLGDGRERRGHGDEADPAAELPRVHPDPAGRDLPFPLTDVQEAYWIGRSGAMELGSVSTHTYFEVDATGMDLDRLERAMRRLIDRHGMLRAVVLPDGTQRILPEVPPYRIAVTDLRGLDPGAEAAGLRALRDRMSHQVLPADRWPLFEVAASRHGDGRLRIHVSFDLLIGDAWSFRIVGRDLFRFYEDPEAALPALELTFRDYVLAEHSLRDGTAYRRALEYWRGRLADLPPAPALPLAKDPSQLAAPRFARRRGRLEPEVWSRLKERAARASLTPSGVLLAAYAEALGAWSASPRFTINLTLFNRLPLHPQVDEVVGDFTSLTLLAVEQLPGESFAERARRLQARLWEDLDHRLVSGVRVLRELREQARARGGEAPIMPVVFTSTLNQPGAEAPAEETPEAGKRDEGYAITQTPQVWLDHQVFERGGALTWSWDAVEELFPAGLLDDLFAAYVGLVESLAHEDEVWTAPVRSLLPEAHRRLIAEANATAAPVPAGLLHEPFLEQAARRPEAVAVITSRREVTYGELDRASLALAHRLRDLGVRPNQLVAVVMEKGWEQVVAVLAILRAGGAYMPVDARLPAERVRVLLEQGEAMVVLTQSAHTASFGIEGLTWIPVDEAVLTSAAPPPLAAVQAPGDLAYVIFTSGSTGTPKGVMIDHRGALNTVVDCNRRFRVTSEDRVLALSSLSFDLSVWDIFGLLAAGGALVIPDAGAHRDPAHWSALGTRAGVTLWNSVPALVEMMVEYAAGRPGVFPPSVRLVMMSGDWIPVRLPDRIREALPRPVELISMGGATEASIWSILYPIGEMPPEWPSVPYGKAMLNQTFFALDDDLEPRPVWVPGALYIGGIGLAQGYWRDAEKTRGAFVTHPRTGERLYRTGDLGRLLPDGNLEFLGRNDTQVKVRGHRIELGEIETTLARHPAVTAAVVSAVGDGQARQLVGYVVLRPSENGSAADALISDPIERLRFKLRHPGLRRDEGRPAVELPAAAPSDAEVDALYLRRRSYRRYSSEAIPLADFAAWLACLRPVDVPGSPFPKYRYASAGNLYPVQLYLFVKEGRIENLAAGTYYYDPALHRLVMLAEGDGINASLYDSVNHPVFEEAGFGLFLVARLAAIVPLYGERGRHFAALEAGLMTQLLETAAPDHRIGLSQIGGVRFEAVRGRLALEESHQLVHTLLGGRLSPAQEGRDAFLDEAAEYHALVGLVEPIGRLEEEPRAAVPPSPGWPSGDGEVFAELRELLRSRLPDYMVPAHFLRIEEVPLSSNGKVDRKALPVPEPLCAREPEAGGSNGSDGMHGAGRPAAPPETELEKVLAGIVGQVLGVPRVGRHDNFFDLGASSVHVVRVHNALRQTLGREVPMVEMFNHPSVALLARHLAGAEPTAAERTPGEPSAALEENRDRSERLREGKDWRKQRLQKRQGRA